MILLNKKTFFLLSAMLLVACEPSPTLQKVSGYTQGTTYHVSFWQKNENIDTNAIKKKIDDELNRIDKSLSNYRPDSDIEMFNSRITTDSQTVSAELTNLIAQARAVSIASNGCYDLTIKPLFDLWGFKDDKITIPTPEKLQEVLNQVGFKQLEMLDETHLRKLNPKLRVDLSSIGQGYSVAQIVNVLKMQGIENYLVEIGGELQAQGRKPDNSAWRVALEKPLSNERTMQKIITIQGNKPLSIMTSGTYRHFFDVEGKRYGHILDATTGKPIIHNTVSVTVFHEDATTAEAWDTALLCVGREEGIKIANQAGIAALFIDQNGENFEEYKSTAMQNLKDITMQ